MGIDDLRRTFEGGGRTSRTAPLHDSPGMSFAKTTENDSSARANLLVYDYEEELQIFLEEVSNTLVNNRQTTFNSSTKEDQQHSSDMALTIRREVLRAEIRTIANQLRDQQISDGLPSSSAQRQTISSLKRKAKEIADDLDRLRREKKVLEIENRDFQDEIRELLDKVSKQQQEIWTMKSDRGELESKIDLAQHTVNALKVDRKRLETYVANLRGEIVEYQNVLRESQMRESQTQRSVSELEHRVLETRKVESALMERVNELVDIQRETLDDMKRVLESKDLTGAKRVMANMTARATNITAKINTLLRRGQNMSSSHDEAREPPVSTSLAGDQEEDIHQAVGVESISRFESAAASSTDMTEVRTVRTATSTRTNIFTRLTRRNLRELESTGADARKAEDSRSIMWRTGRQNTYGNSLEKSLDAAERRTEALREIITSKNEEILRLEDKLKAASDLVARLEMDRVRETNIQRKENRTVHADDKTDPLKRREEILKMRKKPQSLFGWQDFDEESNIKDD